MAKYLSNIDLNKNELQNPVIHPLGTAPSTAADGQIYYNSTDGDKTIYVYDGQISDWKEVGGGVTSLTTTDGTYINLTPNSATTGAVTVTAELSAADGTAAETSEGNGIRYLSKNNKWAEIASIPGTYTFDVSDGTNTETINSGDTVTWTGAGTTTVAYDASSNTFTVNSADQYVGTVTSVNAGTGLTIESGASTIDPEIGIDYSGTDNYILSAGSATDAAAADTINFNDADDNAVKQTTFGDIPIDALTEVKTYIDNSVTGGLIYQGGFDGSTGYVDGTTDYLDSRGTQISVNKGWTYTVTVAGTFYGENVEVGDVLIAEDDLTSGTGALADWTTVQNNVDLASATQVGIGNVVASTSAPLKGLSVAYSNGTATAGLNLSGLTTQAPANNALAFIPFYDQFAGANLKIGLNTLAGDLNEFTSKAYTISDTDTITYPFTLTAATQNDVIIQLVDTVTNETVYADVDRISTTQATITFASTPTNDIRVLVQKIG